MKEGRKRRAEGGGERGKGKMRREGRGGGRGGGGGGGEEEEEGGGKRGGERRGYSTKSITGHTSGCLASAIISTHTHTHTQRLLMVCQFCHFQVSLVTEQMDLVLLQG